MVNSVNLLLNATFLLTCIAFVITLSDAASCTWGFGPQPQYPGTPGEHEIHEESSDEPDPPSLASLEAL